jgi:hypothetical protein
MSDIEELTPEDILLLEGGVAGTAQGEKCLRIIRALRERAEAAEKDRDVWHAKACNSRADQLAAESEAAALRAQLNIERQVVGTEPDIGAGRDPVEAARALRDSLNAAQDEAVALRAQLPEGMEHCTIRFIECPVGHGRLSATNWVDHGCGTCERDALQASYHRVLVAEYDKREALDAEVAALRAENEGDNGLRAKNEAGWAIAKARLAQNVELRGKLAAANALLAGARQILDGSNAIGWCEKVDAHLAGQPAALPGFVGSLAEAFRVVFDHMEAHPDEQVSVSLGGESVGTLPSMNELNAGSGVPIK